MVENKVNEIYKEIPDFGGFLVKANSEGQPGPGDYHRTHAEGANMLAEALAPHGGLVIWRSFVYGNHEGEDRVMQAVTEFKDLDGKFSSNVILQTRTVRSTSSRASLMLLCSTRLSIHR